LPEHAAANFMVGLIYVQKGHLSEGIELMEKGLKKSPWKREWRHDLSRAYQLAGDDEAAAKLQTDDPEPDTTATPEAIANFSAAVTTTSLRQR
ncbi:MAG: hypothetical protein HQL49_13510, partial [Gammaproteobacteria bacterium]|nr:hypothetical protein [Gammaproteobacteria bacterium]